jgi:peptide/nickel transport system substrate-binding protein
MSPASTNRSLVSSIYGAKEMMRGESKELKGFKIISTLEFLIELDEPISFFPAMLAYTPTAIIPEGTREFRDSWQKGCIGTGPFRIIRFEDSGRLEMEANPYYWRPGYPKADRLSFSCGVTRKVMLDGFRSGEYSIVWDIQLPDVERLLQEPEFAATYREVPKLSTGFIALNTHSPTLSDEKMRARFFRALNVEDLVQKCLGRLAVPAHCLIPPGLLGHQPKSHYASGMISQEPLAEPVLLRASLSPRFAERYSSIVKAIASSLELAGFRMEAHTTFSVGKPPGDSDLVFIGWTGDYPDADTFIHDLLHTTEGLVGDFIGTVEIDRLIERGRVESDPEVRDDIYREVQEILTQRSLILPLFYDKVYGFARPEVEGFEVVFSLLQNIPYDHLWIRRG